MLTRRTFIGSSVAGGVGVVGGGAFLLRPAATDAQGRRAAEVDALDDELARQARQAVKDMASRPGEGIRRLAGTLRVKAARSSSGALDEEIRTAFRRELRREGRDALLLRPIDPVQFADEMKQFGIAHPVVPGPIDLKARAEALDLVLGAGFTEFLRRLATALEAQADAIDKSPFARPVSQPGFAPIVAQPAAFGPRPVQWFYAPWEICPILTNQQSHLEMLIAVMCTASMIWAYPAVIGTCVFVSSALASTLVQNYFYGC